MSENHNGGIAAFSAFKWRFEYDIISNNIRGSRSFNNYKKTWIHRIK
jgi:hypothetical protein